MMDDLFKATTMFGSNIEEKKNTHEFQLYKKSLFEQKINYKNMHFIGKHNAKIGII